MDDRKAVALSLVGTFIILMADEGIVKDRAPSPRKIVAFSVVFLILGFMVEVSSKPAKYFAGLLFIGTVLKIGPEVFIRGKSTLTQPSTKRSVSRGKH